METKPITIRDETVHKIAAAMRSKGVALYYALRAIRPYDETEYMHTSTLELAALSGIDPDEISDRLFDLQRIGEVRVRNSDFGMPHLDVRFEDEKDNQGERIAIPERAPKITPEAFADAVAELGPVRKATIANFCERFKCSAPTILRAWRQWQDAAATAPLPE